MTVEFETMHGCSVERAHAAAKGDVAALGPWARIPASLTFSHGEKVPEGRMRGEAPRFAISGRRQSCTVNMARLTRPAGHPLLTEREGVFHRFWILLQ